MAQIAGPLAAADISAYYISTFNFDHALVSTPGGGRGSRRDAEAQVGGGRREEGDPFLPRPAHRCPRTASTASSKSSSGGRRAWAPEATGEPQPLRSPLTPRLPETSLSYFPKLWVSPLPAPPSPTHAGGPPPLCISCVQAPALTWTRVSAHTGNTVLWASTGKPSTHHSPPGLGVCTFPA